MNATDKWRKRKRVLEILLFCIIFFNSQIASVAKGNFTFKNIESGCHLSSALKIENLHV
jgi:hypothetical protein